MSNAAITRKFFQLTDSKTIDTVLGCIASHYGISEEEAKEEVLDDEAESLLDYLVEPVRSAIYVLMQRHCLI